MIAVTGYARLALPLLVLVGGLEVKGSMQVLGRWSVRLRPQDDAPSPWQVLIYVLSTGLHCAVWGGWITEHPPRCIYKSDPTRT